MKRSTFFAVLAAPFLAALGKEQHVIPPDTLGVTNEEISDLYRICPISFDFIHPGHRTNFYCGGRRMGKSTALKAMKAMKLYGVDFAKSGVEHTAIVEVTFDGVLVHVKDAKLTSIHNGRILI